MVDLELLNIHSSREIIARHGLTLPELFGLCLEFYKEEQHQFNLTYEQKNQLAAYWRQSTLGPFHPDKLNPGYFDFVGNDRKIAWEALGDISSNGAMAGFCNLLETTCTNLVPWIRHKKREKQNKIDQEKAQLEAERRKQEEEDLEARKLINIVKRADELKKLTKIDVVESEEEEDMPTLEKNNRNTQVILTNIDVHNPISPSADSRTPESPSVKSPESNSGKTPESSSDSLERTMVPELQLPSSSHDTIIDHFVVKEVVRQSSLTAVISENHVPNDNSNDVIQNGPRDISRENAESADDTQEQLRVMLTQHFACVMYLKQMKESGHTLSAEQEGYLRQMEVYEAQMRAMGLGQSEVSQLEVSQVSDVSRCDSKPLIIAQTESIQTIKSLDTANGSAYELIDRIPEAVSDANTNKTDWLLDAASESLQDIVNSQESFEVVNKSMQDIKPAPSEGYDPTSEDIPSEVLGLNMKLGSPANAEEVSALAETLQKQLPDDVISADDRERESDSDSEVRIWSKTGVALFIAEVCKDEDSILNVGRGETVTVRIPTYESGTALYWEFATEHYDIGFGASFEWEENKEVRREPILPILRRSSQEKVITGSHAYPRSGTYLLLFDNSYSLLRSKTVYYRVFYTR